jgi:hypothetical protein
MKSVWRTIRLFFHFLCTLLGIFFLLWYALNLIVQYSFGTGSSLASMEILIPCLILAAIYTWWERPKKVSTLRNFTYEP